MSVANDDLYGNILMYSTFDWSDINVMTIIIMNHDNKNQPEIYKKNPLIERTIMGLMGNIEKWT